MGKYSDQAKNLYAQILKQYENLQAPNMPWEEYSPEALQSTGEFTPEEAQYKLLQEDPRLLSDQSAYLNQLKALSESGLSAEDAAVFDAAQRQAAQQARGQREAVMSNMAARGLSGSGLELVSKEMANQQAAERARASMMEQAAAAARQKALYTQAYGGELGSQRAANLQSEAQNKNIINRFNELNTGARNTAAAQAIANRQALANANVEARNKAQMLNQAGRQETAQQAYTNQLSRLGALTGAQQLQAESLLAQQQAKRSKFGALGKALGTGIGAIVGGPVGAGIGGSIGGGVGGAI